MQPISLDVLKHAMASVFQDPHAPWSLQAAADLISIGFFFLMRPGEYCNSPNAHPFRFCDVSFAMGNRLLNSRTCPEAALLDATSVLITYTTQKNANRGEKVGQGRSGDPFLCPVRSTARRIIHLRRNQAPDDAPIFLYYPQFRANPQRVASSTITELLRRSARLLNFPEEAVNDIHARSLRATGASALLTAQIDSNLIRLLGRWKSDAMLTYLHAQSAGLIHQFATHMVHRGAADFPHTRRTNVP
jgi:hypothetical protein